MTAAGKAGVVRKRQYLVGWPGEQNCVYGPDEKGKAMFCDRMTFDEAKKAAGSMTIYRLVRVPKRRSKR